MSSSKLCALIEESPEYESVFDEHKIWKRIDPWEWADFLVERPQYVSKCDKYKIWKHFDAMLWTALLQFKP